MILQKEIRAIAGALGLPNDTIDKDFVLGHFLHELFKQPWAVENLVFKGGTCLRKCYFGDYRFSEDIDATITNPEFLLTKKQIQALCQLITEKEGIEFKLLKFEETLFKDTHVGWDIELCFWGANHSKNEMPKFGKDCHTKIWCEFRFYETILFPIEHKKLMHLFSDSESLDVSIPCYSLHEVLAEKMRSLMQRNWGEARDYYDLWYIKNNVDNINWDAVKSAFYKKCTFKNIHFNSVDDFFVPDRMEQVAVNWERRLHHQLTQKVDRTMVTHELKDFFITLFK